jgi:hypothetical protein
VYGGCVMTNYTVRLITLHGRTVSVDLSAVNGLQAATAAVQYFNGRENVDSASGIVVERGGTSFAVFQPRDVLIRLRRHDTDHAGAETTGLACDGQPAISTTATSVAAGQTSRRES